jgi:plasmid stabilization system protein ParE
MAPRRASLSPAAARWLKEEIAAIAKESPKGAKIILANIRKKQELLVKFPQMGERGLIPGTRRVFVRPHYILTVRVQEDLVEVAAIRSTSQQDAYAPSELLAASADPVSDDTTTIDSIKPK